LFDVNTFASFIHLERGLLPELVEDLKGYGIDGMLLSPLDPEDYTSSCFLNHALLRAVEEMHGCYVALAFGGNAQGLASSSKVKALKAYPPAERRQLELAAELCKRLGLPLVISLRVAWGGACIDIDTLRPILSNVGGLKIVLSGVNYTETRWLVSEVASLPNVYVEISMFQQMEGVKFLVKRLGVDRVLFGTAYPLQSPYASLLKLLHSGLSETDVEKVARRNAMELFGLEGY